MKVLVTGHLGYIGPVLVRLLKEAGHTVTGLDSGYFDECLVAGESETRPDRVIIRDLRRIEPDDVAGHDAIIHLAGLSNDPLGQVDPSLTQDINSLATIRLAEMARTLGVSRFVFASSCSMYGAAGESSAPLTEEAPFNPVSAYAVSKVECEQALSAMAAPGFSPVYLRNATAYGVSPRLRFDLVLNNLMAWARTTGVVRVLSDGTPLRPLVHIEDISRAALCALEAPVDSIHNQAFNIGRNDANYRVRDIAEAVVARVPGSQLLITGETAGDLRSYRVDFTKAATRLPGFAARWTLEMGAEELDRWFDGHKVDEQAFQSRLFVRLAQLKHLMAEGRLDSRLFWA
jgi:nucleoside-diphosphate-sugar epimerase